MSSINDLAINGALGAGMGFLASHALNLTKTMIINPTAGALYGATFWLFPTLESLGIIKQVHTTGEKVAKLCMEFFIQNALAMIATHICGFQFAIGPALVFGGVLTVMGLALAALANNWYPQRTAAPQIQLKFA